MNRSTHGSIKSSSSTTTMRLSKSFQSKMDKMSERLYDVVKSGFMIKRAQNKKRFTPVNYKQRWFELTKRTLSYFDVENVEVKPLDAELQKVAIAELGEVPTRVPDDLQALKLWIEQQPHLKARTDDQFLIQFLRGCKFSLEKAKQKLDFFYAFKTKYSDFVGCTDMDSAKFREIHNLGCTAVLPTPLNGCGPRLVMFRFIHPTDKYNFEEVIEPCNAMHQLMLRDDPYACVYGVMYVLDMAQATFNHFLQLTPGYVKKLVTLYEKSLPMRIKGLCYINVPAMAEQFLKLFLSCLSEKIRKRVYICGRNMTSLEEHVPLKYLPQDYGGENGCLQQLTENYHKIWNENREYFKENSQYGIDESLSSANPIDLDGLHGVSGSFRKIEVD